MDGPKLSKSALKRQRRKAAKQRLISAPGGRVNASLRQIAANRVNRIVPGLPRRFRSVLNGSSSLNSLMGLDETMSNSSAAAEILRSLKAAGGNGKALEIALSIALPELKIPIRYATEYTSTPTATAHPFELLKTDWSALATEPVDPLVPNILPVTTALAFLFRSPVNTLIHFDHNDAGLGYEYQLYGTDQFNSDDTTGFEQVAPSTTFRTTAQNQGADMMILPIAYAKPLNNYKPHGDALLCGALPEGSGADVEGHYFWVDHLGTVEGEVLCPSLTETIIIYAKRFSHNQGVEVPARQVVVADGTAQTFSFNDLPAGDYQLGYIVSGATANTDLMTWSGITIMNNVVPPASKGVWCHRSLPHLFANLPTSDTIREFGLGLKITNKAAALYRDGYVTGLQVPCSDRWTDFVRDDVFDFISSKSGQKDTVFDKGFYGFIKPDQDDDFSMMTQWKTNESGVAQTYGPLINKHSYIVICAQVINPLGRNSYWSVTSGIEFTTSDTWRQKEITRYTPEDFKIAMRMLKDVPQFHQNDLHLAGIFNAIRNAAKDVIGGIQKYGPMVMNAANVASSFL